MTNLTEQIRRYHAGLLTFREVDQTAKAQGVTIRNTQDGLATQMIGRDRCGDWTLTIHKD